MEATNPITIESAAEALMAPVESEATENESPKAEVAEVEEEEVEQESESDDDAEYAEEYDDDDEYDESNDEQADQSGPETYSIKVNGENVDVTLNDLKQSFSGQK